MSSSFLLPVVRRFIAAGGKVFRSLFTRVQANELALFQADLSTDQVRRAGLCPGLVRDHSMDFWRVSLAHQRISVKLAFALRVLRRKNVALERFAALDLASGGLLETFGCAFVCFQFGHIFSRRLRRLAIRKRATRAALPHAQ